MNANGRRCRQFKNGFRHLARIGRPIYKATATSSVQAAIERERAIARRQAAMKKKPK